MSESRHSLIKDGKFTPGFDTLVAETIKRWNVPGLSIAVVEGDATCAKVSMKSGSNCNSLIVVFRDMVFAGCQKTTSSRTRCSTVLA